MKLLTLALLVYTPALAEQPLSIEALLSGHVERDNQIREKLGDLATVALNIRKTSQWCPEAKEIRINAAGEPFVFCDDGTWGAWYKVTLGYPLQATESEAPIEPQLDPPTTGTAGPR